MSGKIQLIVSDIEGCLSPGKGAPLELAALREIQLLNVRAKQGLSSPLTLCTGRSQPFVEAFCQMLQVFVPCVCENGALLYDPSRDVCLRNPLITELHLKARMELIQFLEHGFPGPPPRREPGKEICISLNSDVPRERAADEIVRLYERVRNAIDLSLFSVTHSFSAVDITPAGIDKGSGVGFLSRMTGIPPGQMLGIGDSAGDVPFLGLTGISAAPSNCSEEVRELVQYVSKSPAAGGVLDIIAWGSGRDLLK